jgi:hypothetical protein
MALDIHELEDGAAPGKLIYQIDDRNFRLLLPAFIFFENKTGMVICQYDDLVLWSGSAQIVNHLEGFISQLKNSESKLATRNLITALLPYKNKAIGFFGD